MTFSRGRRHDRAWLFVAVVMSVSPSFAATDLDEQVLRIARELTKGAQESGIHRVAVEPFMDLDGNVTPLGRLLAAEVTTELETRHAIRMVDPQHLATQLEKSNVTRLSSLPRGDLEKLGKKLQLEGIIAGSVVESVNHLRLTVKLTAVRTGTVVTAAKATLSKTGFLAELAPPSAQPPQPAQKSDTAAVSSTGDRPDGMVLIPAGPFLFGEGEQQRTITLPTFWMDVYEVTNGRYGELRVIEYDEHRGHHPVTNVSWTQARQFCDAKGKRLPTEQEWEKAARGEDGRLYPWGNTYESSYVNAENRVGEATSVGRFEDGRSPYGVYDMAGNVMEWTDSGDDLTKVFRGGSWASAAQDVRTTSKKTLVPAYRLVDLGFRCAKDGPPER